MIMRKLPVGNILIANDMLIVRLNSTNGNFLFHMERDKKETK